MANIRRYPRTVSTMIAFLTLAGTNTRRILAAVTTLIFAVTCMAQDGADAHPQPTSPPDSQTTMQAPATPNPATETIPAGTRLALVLTNPIFSTTTHRADEIH